MKDIKRMHDDILGKLEFAAMLVQRKRLPNSFQPSNVHDIKEKLLQAIKLCDELLAHRRKIS